MQSPFCIILFNKGPTNHANGHQIVERTQLSDVALFCATQTRIFKICIQCRLLRN